MMHKMYLEPGFTNNNKTLNAILGDNLSFQYGLLIK